MSYYSANPPKAVTKSDLKFTYHGNPGDNLLNRGEPDRSLLSRHSDYEVLYFINEFALKYGDNRSAVALKAERLIKQHLPVTVRSHENVTTWLLRNWSIYL